MKPTIPFPFILLFIISWYNIVCSVEVERDVKVKTASTAGIN